MSCRTEKQQLGGVKEHLGGLRKGAWTKEEDLLLRKCIEKYGEGKWRQVPLRAGLKRCRKSCRLRWLNYLSPNIKRGQFSEEEVELIIKLHKLLGNRWSLIAGRIPGRTANDVKNYWNSHLSKKLAAKAVKPKDHHVVIKPKPRTAIPIHSNWFKEVKSTANNHQPQEINRSSSTPQLQPEDSTSWWETLLAEAEKRGEESSTSSGQELGTRKDENGMEGFEWDDWILDLDLLFK